MPVRRHSVWAVKLFADLALLAAAFPCACLVRFEGEPPPFILEGISRTLPLAAGLQFVCLAALVSHRSCWRHVGLAEGLRVTAALGMAGVLLGLFRAFQDSPWLPVLPPGTVLPWGVIILDTVLGSLGVVGVRVLCRLASERGERRERRPVPRERTLLVGAGRAGAMVAREIAARPDLGLEPVGFLDDDRNLLGVRVGGVPVVGTTGEVAELARRHGAGQALITIANGSAADIARISRLCRACGLPVKIIPPLHEIVGGRINLAAARDIALEDLLGRPPVRLDDEDIRASLHGRRVLVTGAGGSIGSELCRTVCGYGADTLVLVERAENSLFDAHRRLEQAAPGVRLVPCVADIRDPARMGQIFADLAPHAVFHAAAHKHVPLMESNPAEAVKNNVLGTAALVRLAHEHGVGRFVMISTDKAVKPASVMGASKRAAELFVQAFSRTSRTRFVTVRFGNVLGSNGSVIPLFREQIAAGRPVTVTHPDMRRYFMTIPEACQLVLQAAVMGKGGEIFILDMGEPVKIVDLARSLILLSGLVPGRDVPIEFTGLRPGEKLSEELFSGGEDVGATSHPRVVVGRQPPPDWEVVRRQIDELGELAVAGDLARMYAKLREVVPDYAPRAADDDGEKVWRADAAHVRESVPAEVGVDQPGGF